MADCKGCTGGCCESCGGCGGTLELSQGEMDLLQTLGQYSFLPVARKADDMLPVYREADDYTPLPGADMAAYAGYPVHGSMGLTKRGQDVLDLLEKQGVEE